MNMKDKMAVTLIQEFREVGHSFDWRQAKELSDTILDAMREPGPAVEGAGLDLSETLVDEPWNGATPKAVWQAMIDAIKAGK